jgi:hypothetical protein
MMKKILVVLTLFVHQVTFAGGMLDTAVSARNEEKYYDYGTSKGVTIYNERSGPIFPSKLTESYILFKLSGFSSDREQFIKEDLLKNAGFRSTAGAKFRKTSGEEKAVSVLYGITHAFSLGVVPVIPFFEVNYARLPQNEFYTFGSVVPDNQLEDISPEVRTTVELEYMLQVEFCDGVLIRDYNVDYYTEENIAKFEELARSLPDDASPEIRWLKGRYLTGDLPRIRAALDRYKNPTELDLIARQNLSDILVTIKNNNSPQQNARRTAGYYEAIRRLP